VALLGFRAHNVLPLNLPEDQRRHGLPMDTSDPLRAAAQWVVNGSMTQTPALAPMPTQEQIAVTLTQVQHTVALKEAQVRAAELQIKLDSVTRLQRAARAERSVLLPTPSPPGPPPTSRVKRPGPPIQGPEEVKRRTNAPLGSVAAAMRPTHALTGEPPVALTRGQAPASVLITAPGAAPPADPVASGNDPDGVSSELAHYH
jgi:hypothetical protein